MNKRKISSLSNNRFTNTQYHSTLQNIYPLTDYNNNFIATNPYRYFPKNKTICPTTQKKLLSHLENSFDNLKSKEKNLVEKSDKKTVDILQMNSCNLENNLDSSMETIKNILFGNDKNNEKKENNKKNKKNKSSQNKPIKTSNNQKRNKSQNLMELTGSEKNNLRLDYIPNYYDLGSKYLIRNYITNNNTNVNYHKIQPKKVSMNRLYDKSILVSKNIFYFFRIVVFYQMKKI